MIAVARSHVVSSRDCLGAAHLQCGSGLVKRGASGPTHHCARRRCVFPSRHTGLFAPSHATRHSVSSTTSLSGRECTSRALCSRRSRRRRGHLDAPIGAGPASRFANHLEQPPCDVDSFLPGGTLSASSSPLRPSRCGRPHALSKRGWGGLRLFGSSCADGKYHPRRCRHRRRAPLSHDTVQLCRRRGAVRRLCRGR